MRSRARHGLPPFLHVVEASGQAQGGPADASTGMQLFTDGSGQSWAWNPSMSEWQLRYTVKWGDTLYVLSGRFYGQASVTGVHRIYGVPQNQPIAGSSLDQCVPGDVLLIPGLAQPQAIPPVGGGVSLPLPVPSPEQPTPAQPTPTPIGIELPTQPPPGWPPSIPWPPLTGVQPTPTEPTPAEPTPTEPTPAQPYPGGAVPIPIGTTQPGAPTPKKTWWTAGRTAAVAIIGTAGVAGVVALIVVAAKKNRRRRRSH